MKYLNRKEDLAVKIYDPQKELGSLDLLKIIAMFFVTIHHFYALLNAYNPFCVFRITFGEMSVAIFCAISGYLGVSSKDDLKTWAIKRLLRILPSYWIVTILAFSINWLFKYKDFSLFQFISQLLGIGYFTHGYNLVNIVSWFVSLILLCYLISGISRIKVSEKWFYIVNYLAITVCVLLILFGIKIALARFVIPFCAASIFQKARNKVLFILIFLFMFSFFGLINFNFYYSLFSILILFIAVLIPTKRTKLLRLASYYSYEYFLIHGIVLLFFIKFLHNHSFYILLVAMPVAAFLSVIIKKISSTLLNKVIKI